MTVKRPITLPTIAGALLLGGAMTALLTAAFAQDFAAPRLRGFDEERASPTLPTLAPRDPRDERPRPGVQPADPSRPAVRASSRSARPARPRRMRSATMDPVRTPVRGTMASPDVAREVQPIMVGVPDPSPLPAAPRRRPMNEDPYAQLGFRVGGVTVLPAIQESIGHDTNPNRVSGKSKGSFVSRTEGDVALQSDWSVHALTGLLRGSYSTYPDVEGADRPEGEGRLGLRLDATRDLQFDLEARGRLDTERPGSPEFDAVVSERPLVATTGASVGATQRFNRLSLGLRGTVDRTDYEDARLASGAILDQSDRNTTQYGLRARAGYELTPGVIPFVEALADTRVHDRSIDRAGFSRDSDGVGMRAGSTFEITRTLTGEVAAGAQVRRYEDPRLRDLRGPLVDAALAWSATALTTVRLRAQSRIDESTIPNASGAIVQSAGLEVQHDLRRNLSVIAAAGITESDYRGIFLREETLTGSVRADYKLTRSIVLRASFTHERLKSTSPGSDYTANTYLVGLRFQP